MLLRADGEELLRRHRRRPPGGSAPSAAPPQGPAVAALSILRMLWIAFACPGRGTKFHFFRRPTYLPLPTQCRISPEPTYLPLPTQCQTGIAARDCACIGTVSSPRGTPRGAPLEPSGRGHSRQLTRCQGELRNTGWAPRVAGERGGVRPPSLFFSTTTQASPCPCPLCGHGVQKQS